VNSDAIATCPAQVHELLSTVLEVGLGLLESSDAFTIGIGALSGVELLDRPRERLACAIDDREEVVVVVAQSHLAGVKQFGRDGHGEVGASGRERRVWSWSVPA